jgi:phosphoglycolate phosphatase-like HAD superfamily hydrolase
MDLNRYPTLIFDCDGVILDSNKVKTDAFFNSALPYGSQAANELVGYHRKHGGISRYKKFEYFLHSILRVPVEQTALDFLLLTYAREVQEGLLKCSVSPGLDALRQATPKARWMVISGGDQNELRSIFRQRTLTHYFDGGIFGSPDTKDTILIRELANSNIKMPALFIGDSRYDHEAASRAGLDFVFISNWTEFSGWQSYQQTMMFSAVPDLFSLVNQTT